jgi:hypothetical protein
MSESIFVNGKEFRPSADFPSILRSQLRAMSGLTEKYDLGPEAGIRRLFEAARGTDIEGPLTTAVMQILIDPDPELRTGAVRIMKQYPDRFDPRRVIQILDGNRDLFQGVKPTKGDDPDLAWGILRAVSGHPSHDPAVIDPLRKAALDPEKGSMILGGLSIDDPEWVVDHAVELVAGDSIRAAAILINLDQPADRGRFVKVAGSSAEARDAVVSAVEQHIKDPIERARLRQLIG